MAYARPAGGSFRVGTRRPAGAGVCGGGGRAGAVRPVHDSRRLGPLFFADAATFRTELLNLVANADVTAVVVDFEATSHVDLDGADMLTKVNEELADTGVRLMLTHTNASELEMLQRAGTLNALGEANLFETARAAVAAATQGRPESRTPVPGATT
jgi:anti-anti-sigma regulatory factor